MKQKVFSYTTKAWMVHNDCYVMRKKHHKLYIVYATSSKPFHHWWCRRNIELLFRFISNLFFQTSLSYLYILLFILFSYFVIRHVTKFQPIANNKRYIKSYGNFYREMLSKDNEHPKPQYNRKVNNYYQYKYCFWFHKVKLS